MNWEFLFIFGLIIHFLGDFALQTDDQSKMKSNGWSIFNTQLFYHVGTYSIIWFLGCLSIHTMIGFTLRDCVYFSIITFFAHYITDWSTSRIGKPFWKKGDYHNGFVVVGMDQILHYLQLYYTFKLLM